MKTRAAIALTGALGFVAVLKTSFYYASLDHLAFGITLLMGIALLSGLAELWRVSRGIEALSTELGALPIDASAERLEQASAALHALLRSRLDRSHLAVPGPVFAPFLAGLLVMLGLLGTFMGLFETLRGASIALTTGSDIDALRAGLKTPMLGLMRSFGTSAAGVASSAMLSLANVFTRKASAQLAAQLHQVTSGPLSRLSESRRQLAALESLSSALTAALASQERAVPDAANALQKAHEALASRAASIDTAIDRQLGAMRDAVDTMSSRLQQSEHEAQTRLASILNSIQETQARHVEHLAGLEEALVTKLRETIEAVTSEHQGQLLRFATVEDNLIKHLASASQGLLQIEAVVTERQRDLSQQLEAFVHAQEVRSQTWEASSREQHDQRIASLSQLFAQQLTALQATHNQSAALVQEAEKSQLPGGEAAAAGAEPERIRARAVVGDEKGNVHALV